MTMPDGRLTPDEKTRVQAWLNSHWHFNQSCPVCNQNQWQIADHVVDFKPWQGGNLVVGGISYPTVLVACGNCSFFRCFSAMAMGVKLSPAAGK